MATPFRIKRSAVPGKIPAVSDLQLGELALNTYDAELYTLRSRPGIGTDVVRVGSSAITNTLYVTKDGNDGNSGLTVSDSKATIKSAVGIATEGTVIKVSAGTYIEDNPIKVPAQVSIVGDTLREVTISPLNVDKDIFHVGPGDMLQELTFSGTVDHGVAVVAFDPDKIQYVNQSPYVRFCTNKVSNSIGLKVDGNDAIGPFKSMVTDSYTQYNLNGIGVSVSNEGYAQIVSLFTMNLDAAVVCSSGGQCDVTNSNSSFGNFGLIADGVGPLQYTGTIATAASENADKFEIDLSTPVFSISDAVYDGVTGLTTVTTNGDHGFAVGMAVTMSRLGFTCDYGDYAHTFVSAATSSINVTGAGQTQPTGATYDPNTGLMTLTVANHGFPAPNPPATISTATYTPSTGVLRLHSVGHGLSDGDYVKLLPNSLTFTCEKDNHATEHSYPRVSDPAYNTWLQVSNVDTPNHKFDVNVGVSEYTAEYWFKSGTSNNLLRAETTISLDPESLIFTCDKDNHATQHSYPRAKDPSYNKILGVESVPNNNTFTVNVGVSTNDIFPDNNGNVFSVVSVPTANSFTVYTGPNEYPHNYIGGGKVLLNVVRPFDGKVAYFDNQYYSIGKINLTNPGSGYNSPPTITIEHPNETTNSFAVTVANKTAAHPYFGQGSGKGYYITGGSYDSITQAPVINFVRGSTYTFHQNDSSNSTHAIYFSELETAYGGSNRYETGVTYTLDGVDVDYATYDAGHSTATTRSVSITVASDAPNTLYYACQAHPYMGASISIGNGSLGWGVHATAVATIFNGRVDELEIISNGRGYTSLPQITFSAPDVGINTATATLELLPTYYSVKECTQIATTGICTVTINENVPYSLGVGNTVPFFRQSRALASSHSFQYIGSGVDPISSLPSRGGVTIQENEVDNRNGGLVIYTSTDQGGNFRIGEGVVIDQVSGTIAGNFYSKSLFANVTPLILALGGDQ